MRQKKVVGKEKERNNEDGDWRAEKVGKVGSNRKGAKMCVFLKFRA